MVEVLRLGHRISRDTRITTHVCLVSRAFGAKKVVLSGEQDDSVMTSVKKLVDSWGGPFGVGYAAEWELVIEKFKKRGGIVVHLTMYGEPIQKKIGLIRKMSKKRGSNVMVVVGAGKVPTAVYQMSDFNIAVTSQPHSEVAALAVFLHEFFGGKELSKTFGGKLKIVPKRMGKCVVSSDKRAKAFI